MERFTEVSVRNYSCMLDLEKNFMYQDKFDWMNQNWTNVFYYIILYIFVIFGTKYYMQDKPRFSLRPLLILWNLGLTSFSALALLRTAPEFIHIISNHGFYYSVCVPSYITLDPVSGYWAWLVVLSKLVELGDTVFIVLRKQPLIFLHWYHHIVTLLIVWYTYSKSIPLGRWSLFMNLLIHSVMYFYYALRAMGYTPPRQMSMFITSVQILQMILGCGINIYVYNLLNNNISCEISYESIGLIFFIYFSYMILFANFFYQSYVLSKNKTKTDIKSNHKYSKTKVH